MGLKNHTKCSERVLAFCDKQIKEIKDELEQRGYEPEYPYKKLTWSVFFVRREMLKDFQIPM